MYKRGLKLWSVNTDFYYYEAIKLYKAGMYDYIELYVVPDTLETLPYWEKLHHLNLTDISPKEKNCTESGLITYNIDEYKISLPQNETESLNEIPLPWRGAEGRVVRNTKNYKLLPYNPALKERAKELRKASNLSEVLIWNELKNKKFKGLDFDRQKIIGNYIVDFYCSNNNVVIEIDGISHNEKYQYDIKRDNYLKTLGIKVIHILDSDVKNNLNGVMVYLCHHPAFGTPPKEGNSIPAFGTISMDKDSNSAFGIAPKEENLSHTLDTTISQSWNSPPSEEYPLGGGGFKGIPFIIHNAHFAQGFNLAKKEKEARNREIYEQTKQFADKLDAKYIIFHGGIDGDIRETAIQLAMFNEPRALIENKPYVALPNRMGGEFCRGYNIEEIKLVMETANCGFCLDFGHAICAANSLNEDVYDYCQNFLQLNPNMFHLTDLNDITSPFDSHLHLSTGELDFKRIFDMIPNDSYVTFETVKNSKENLNDFIEDMEWLKNIK